MKYFKLQKCDKKERKNLKPEKEDSNHWNMIYGFGEVEGKKWSI